MSWNIYVRAEVFKTVTIKNAVFGDVVPCSSCVNLCFRGIYRLHLQGRKIIERGARVSMWLQTSPVICFPSLFILIDRLCGLVVRVPGYRSRGLVFDSRLYQIFWEVVGLVRGPLSLVREYNWGATWMESSGSGSRKLRLTAVGTRCADHATPSIC
jgi:hypothetical protein